MQVINYKAQRQQEKRDARQGNRYARQRDQRREAPNVRLRQCVSGAAPYLGYNYVRLRDGKII